MVAFILGHVDSSDQINRVVRSQTLYVAAVSLGCLVLSLRMSSPATLFLFHQPLLSRKYINSFSHCGHFEMRWLVVDVQYFRF